jgi:hypothetical protein
MRWLPRGKSVGAAVAAGRRGGLVPHDELVGQLALEGFVDAQGVDAAVGARGDRREKGDVGLLEELLGSERSAARAGGRGRPEEYGGKNPDGNCSERSHAYCSTYLNW